MKTIYPFMGLTLCSVTIQTQEKPNFLIIQCDHLTQRVVGAYGQTQGCTLPIDEVASRGVIFSNAYVGCPLSQPSRAALWSGMMPHQTNVRSNSSEPINPRIPEFVGANEGVPLKTGTTSLNRYNTSVAVIVA